MKRTELYAHPAAILAIEWAAWWTKLEKKSKPFRPVGPTLGSGDSGHKRRMGRYPQKATHSGIRRDELADLSRDFNFMAERIQKLVLSQRRLTSDIPHELRSPLARLAPAAGRTTA